MGRRGEAGGGGRRLQEATVRMGEFPRGYCRGRHWTAAMTTKDLGVLGGDRERLWAPERGRLPFPSVCVKATGGSVSDTWSTFAGHSGLTDS